MSRLRTGLGLALAIALLALVANVARAEEMKGKIKSITPDKREFSVTDNVGANWDFLLDENGKIRLDEKDVKLSDAKEGDEVTVTYEKKDGKLIASEVRVKKQ